MKRLLALPLYVKLLAPTALAICCLLLYLAFSIIVLDKNNTRLEVVRDVHFPVLDTMTRNVARLDELVNGLNGAAASGDMDMLQATQQAAEVISNSYQQLQQVDSEQAENTALLRAEFNEYYAIAYAVAEEFVNQNPDTNPDDIEKMTHALNTYRTHLAATHELADKRFRDTVQTAVDGSHRAMLIGILLGVVGLITSVGFALRLARAISAPLSRAMHVAQAVADGRLDAEIHIHTMDEGGKLLLAMSRMQRQLRAVIDAQNTMAALHEQGQISHRIDPTPFPGDYGSMVRATNGLVSSHVDTTMRTLEVLKHYANGDFSVDIERLPGEKAVISETIDSLKVNLSAINAEIKRLAAAAAHGEFCQRGDEDSYQHDFKAMVSGLNQLMETTDSNLAQVSHLLQTIADGNLTQRMHGQFHGVFAKMRDDSNATIEQLTHIIGRIQRTATSINQTAGDIASGNVDLSQRTEQQAINLQQTAASMEELTTTVRQNAEHARQANALAMSAAAVASEGGAVVGKVVQTMGDIEQSSKKIGDIISVIDGIAFQTNILALNAAVEAARAGEQGRGFAVVASEVRTLAQRSADAAKEIKNLIDDSVGKVADGSALVQTAGTTMQQIVSSVERVNKIMAEISAASQEQTSGIEQVNQTVIRMDETTQQNAVLVEQATASARSMAQQAKDLTEAVAAFHLLEDARQTANLPASPISAAAATGRAVTPPRPSSTPLHDTISGQWSQF